jgi:hypothetical protein
MGDDSLGPRPGKVGRVGVDDDRACYGVELDVGVGVIVASRSPSSQPVVT